MQAFDNTDTGEHITVHVNDQIHRVQSGYSVSDLIRQLSLEARQGIALAVNSDVIPLSDWNRTLLNDRDHILIIHATQGG
ncbi:MAG: sulfur carrier protein ThiS [Flavobacteriales bacterium]|nr:sulfur carrier protein ThiS [Flavobacteriales bacterium]MCB9448414.1 sulfur carrier protein ThiS [Flavobacteriales bacterium]